MSEEQFLAEKLYYIAMSVAKTMLQKSVIDEAVYAIIQEKMLDQYRPISAVLLSGKRLT